MMVTRFSTYIGIDISSGRGHPMAFAMIDQDKVIRLLGRGEFEDAFAFLAGQSEGLLVINDPMLGETLRLQSIGDHNHSAHQTMGIPRSLYESMLTDTYTQRQKRLRKQLIQALGELEYIPFPAQHFPKQFAVHHSEAFFLNVLNREPISQKSLEGRIQRQVALALAGLHVPNAMRYYQEITRHKLLTGQLPTNMVYTIGELHALTCALTAWLLEYQPDNVYNFPLPQNMACCLARIPPLV